MQVLPKQSPKDETRIDVDVMVRERPLRTAEINAEWGFAPGPSGRPSLTSIVPGACGVWARVALCGQVILPCVLGWAVLCVDGSTRAYQQLMCINTTASLSRSAALNTHTHTAAQTHAHTQLHTHITTGGSITFEDRNVHNNGSSLSATIDAPNFLQPGEDLGFRLEYKRPYIYGDRDRKKTAMTVSAFNVRKQSAVYKSGTLEGVASQHA